MKALGRPGCKDHRALRGPVTGIVLLLLAGLIAQGACLPHTHSGIAPGVYNAEHDLTLLAASGTTAPLPVVPAFFVAFVTGSVVCPPPPAAASLICRDA